MMYYLERIIISSIVWFINYCRTIIWIVVKDSVKSLLLRLFYPHRTSLDMAPSSFSVLKKLKMRRWKQSWYLSTEIEEHAYILNLNDKAQLRNGIRWIRVSTFSMCEASKLGYTYVDLCSVNKLRHVQAEPIWLPSRLRRREPWPFVAPEARSLLVFTSADPKKNSHGELPSPQNPDVCPLSSQAVPLGDLKAKRQRRGALCALHELCSGKVVALLTTHRIPSPSFI